MPHNRARAKMHRSNKFLKTRVFFDNVTFSESLINASKLLGATNTEVAVINSKLSALDNRAIAVDADLDAVRSTVTPQIIKARDEKRDAIELLNDLTISNLLGLGLTKVENEDENGKKTTCYVWDKKVIATVTEGKNTIEFADNYKIGTSYLLDKNNVKILEEYKTLKNKDCLTSWGQNRVDKKIAKLEANYPDIKTWIVEKELRVIKDDYALAIEELNEEEFTKINNLEQGLTPYKDELSKIQAEYDSITSKTIIQNKINFIKEHAVELAIAGKDLNLKLDTINIIPYQTDTGVAYTSVETIAATFLGLQAEGKSVGLYEVKILADALIEELYKDIIVETQTYKYGSTFESESEPNGQALNDSSNEPSLNEPEENTNDDTDSFNQ